MNPPSLLVAIVASLAGLSGVGWGQFEIGGGVTATAEIVGQRYCIGEPVGGIILKRLPPDAITLRLAVRLTYRNENGQPQIFQELPNINIVISSSLKDALKHENQTMVQYGARRAPWQPGDGSLETDQPQDSWFTILPPTPNGVREIEYNVGFQVYSPAERPPNMGLLGKKIFFQLDLNHALLPQEVTRDLQIKWRSYGSLWAARIRTQPIAINIPRLPATAKCVSEFRID